MADTTAPWVQDAQRMWNLINSSGRREWKVAQFQLFALKWYKSMGVDIPWVPAFIERRLVRQYSAKVINAILDVSEAEGKS